MFSDTGEASPGGAALLCVVALLPPAIAHMSGRPAPTHPTPQTQRQDRVTSCQPVCSVRPLSSSSAGSWSRLKRSHAHSQQCDGEEEGDEVLTAPHWVVADGAETQCVFIPVFADDGLKVHLGGRDAVQNLPGRLWEGVSASEVHCSFLFISLDLVLLPPAPPAPVFTTFIIIIIIVIIIIIIVSSPAEHHHPPPPWSSLEDGGSACFSYF